MFSPAYIIFIHLEYFGIYYQKCSTVKSRSQTRVRNLEFISGVFDQTISTRGQLNQIQLEITQNNNYRIKKEPPNSYFSLFSSCKNIFIGDSISTSQGTYKILFLKLRIAKHKLLDNVQIKYFGEVISSEYKKKLVKILIIMKLVLTKLSWNTRFQLQKKQKV